MTIRTVTFAATLMLSMPAVAQSTPPADSLPLSEIVAMIEAEADTAWVKEVEWDSDGYWEIEYYTDDGREVEVEIDPVTGYSRR